MSWAELASVVGSYLIVAGLAGIVGAGLGYYTAAKDLEEEKRKVAAMAWNEGYNASRNPHSWDAKNPYTKESTR